MQLINNEKYNLKKKEHDEWVPLSSNQDSLVHICIDTEISEKVFPLKDVLNLLLLSKLNLDLRN